MRTPFVLAVATAAVFASTAPAAAAAGAWSQVPAPNPNVQFTNLQAVDALSDTSAWAVGYVTPPQAGPAQPLALRWNGTSWANVPVPLLGIGTRLWGVSASSANEAWAVGSFSSHPPGYSIVTNPVAMHWNGTAWSSVTVPGGGTLFGVADLSPANAWAIGDTVKHWDGTAWTNVATPSPNPSGVGTGSLSAISARSATDIWVVGSFSPRRHQTAAFSLHYDGVSWRVVPMPANIQLWGVAIIGANDAWAVGQLNTGTIEPATVHWDGTAWSLVASPTVPAGAYLRAVSARSGNDVWAVGPAFTGEANAINALTIHWNGTSWSAAATPSGNSPNLWAVSARSAGHTWAVGDQNPGVPLILERH